LHAPQQRAEPQAAVSSFQAIEAADKPLENI